MVDRVMVNVFLEWTTNDTRPESVFHLKIQIITGSLMVVSLVEIVMALTGLASLISRIITPLTLATIYVVLALSITETLMDMMDDNWPISITGVILMIIFIIILADKVVPIPTWTRKYGCVVQHFKIFQLSPVLWTLFITWSLCAILTLTNVFRNDPKHWTYLSRVDSRTKAMTQAQYFLFPYPGRWGYPRISLSAVIGLSLAIMLSVVESVGDYILTAKICKAPNPPNFATNRGILVEGVGVLLSGVFGTVSAPTSYTGNIGILQATRAGHRTIGAATAIFMIICGVFPFIGAIFVNIPTSAVGGTSLVLTLLILNMGISYLLEVNIRSVRNALIFCCSIGFGLYIPSWTRVNGNDIKTGNSTADEVILLLLSQGLFIGAFLSILMENIIPGRSTIPKSFKVANSNQIESFTNSSDAYEITLLKKLVLKVKCLQFLPIFPAYKMTSSDLPMQMTDGSVETSTL